MSTEDPRVRHRFLADRGEAGIRLDLALVARFPGYSRSKLQRLVKDGHAQVNGNTARPGRLLHEGDLVLVDLEFPAHPFPLAEDIPLTILYEDRRIVVVDKPPGLTVHPGSGEKRGTLVNALAYRFGLYELSGVQGPMRPGIVHRLDRDTSGVILVAKDDEAHLLLANQFKSRTVSKTYLAVCQGTFEFDADFISLPLGRDLRNPERIAVRWDVGRPSETYYEVRERFPRHTLVEVHPRTGRTHQIRVHLAALGHPIVGDRVYGRPEKSLRALIGRQALHAWRLEIHHPETGDPMVFTAPLPPDMEGLLAFLRAGLPDTEPAVPEELGETPPRSPAKDVDEE